MKNLMLAVMSSSNFSLVLFFISLYLLISTTTKKYPNLEALHCPEYIGWSTFNVVDEYDLIDDFEKKYNVDLVLMENKNE